jgi:nucleotide-binding universal stress UspA family protein
MAGAFRRMKSPRGKVKIMRKILSRKLNTARKRQLRTGQLQIRHIVVPMDFSGYARQALTCAVPLAHKCRAKISLVHVVQPPTVSAWRGIPGGGHYLNMQAHNLVAVAETQLDDLATQLLPNDVRGRTIVREGNAGAEVVAVAKHLKANLIVLSNTGRSGLRRILLGSTAERIVRHAHCPVLTVRRKQSGPAMRLLSLEKPLYTDDLPWKRLLVPLDFSPTSLRALKIAVPLAKASAASLILLNVVEPNPYPTGTESALLVAPDSEVMQAAEKGLPQIARRFIPKSVRANMLVQRGRAADVIVETAEKNKVDLIVLSTHGHTGLERLLMGSVAEQVVRHAKCPVFVVRKPRIRRSTR